VDDDGDGGSEPDDAFDCSNHYPSQMLKSAPLTIACPTGTCTTSVCCTLAPAPPSAQASSAGRSVPMAAAMLALAARYILLLGALE
jgi:hypothetical protein